MWYKHYCCELTTFVIYNSKTSRVWDIGRQRVVKYEVLNEFEERVQNEVFNHELPPIIPYKCGFSFITLYRDIFVIFHALLSEIQQFCAKMIKNPNYRPKSYKSFRKFTKIDLCA